MLKHKHGIITIYRLLVEQKRRIDELEELLDSEHKRYTRLLIEKEYYRRECNRRKGYADVMTPISERVQFYANGGRSWQEE